MNKESVEQTGDFKCVKKYRRKKGRIRLMSVSCVINTTDMQGL